MTKRKDTAATILADLIDTAIPCHNGATGRNGYCHGVADSTNLVRRARALVKAKRRGVK